MRMAATRWPVPRSQTFTVSDTNGVDHLYFKAKPVITRAKNVVVVRKCCTRSDTFIRSYPGSSHSLRFR